MPCFAIASYFAVQVDDAICNKLCQNDGCKSDSKHAVDRVQRANDFAKSKEAQRVENNKAEHDDYRFVLMACKGIQF